ncbi:MAG: LLM class F420-dependent oxidoreductase [Ktedonobacteraceae bacterium]|nr:LLM class F420-dependent oxidoreductase [Ktedonobacteraceae bacterium]
MASIRIGVQLHQQHTTYQALMDAVHTVESMGVDTIFDCDHFFPLYGNPHGNHFEGWTLLTAIAALTQRAEVGCLVSCASFRNPALLSNMAKTVDHISHGRLILGLGAGIFERDFQEYGYEFGTPARRLDVLEQAVKIIQQRWQLDRPEPVRRIPLLIGGGGEKKTLRIAAQYANIWHGFGDPATYRHKVAVLHRWCAEFGRDPREIECAVSPPRNVSAAELDDYVEAGATHFIIGGLGAASSGAAWNLERVERVLEWRKMHSQ